MNTQSSYDEDLSENPFLLSLKTDFAELFSKAVSEQWLICVPRRRRWRNRDKEIFSQQSFTKHILVANDEVPVSHFRSLFDTEVRIVDSIITAYYGTGSRSSRILFQETCYNDSMQRYKLLCIDVPLDTEEEGKEEEDGEISGNLANVSYCTEFLWTEVGGQQLLREIEQLSLTLSPAEASPDDNACERSEFLREEVGKLYSAALKETMKCPYLHTRCGKSPENVRQVEMAVQTYLMSCLHKEVLGRRLQVWHSRPDAELNRRIRNADDVQMEELGVLKEFEGAIPKARVCLARIDEANSPLGKLECLRKTLKALLARKRDDDVMTTSTDEILPALMFVVLKTDIPNWISQLHYISRFRFPSRYQSGGQEDDFIVTTFEAALEHIRSGQVKSGGLALANSSPVHSLLLLVQEGNVEAVTAALRKESEDEDTRCHPLCDCPVCVGKTQSAANRIGVNSADDDSGLTPLHVASLHGQAAMVELLLSLGAKKGIADRLGRTPVHCACSRGHQNALLLLQYADAALNAVDFEGNTPLHLAASNGHVSCVKALVFFSEHRSKFLDLNATNHIGDTPLHLAARWGFFDIVQLLLDYHAKCDIRNKQRATAAQCAHDCWIENIIDSSRGHTDEVDYFGQVSKTS